jgi:hypothetical protein
MDVIEQVGAFAGLAAFLGLAVLALLYFAQARDVRRLRENAEFLVEGDPVPGGDEEADTEAAEAAAAGPLPAEPEAAARKAAATAPNDAEAFRRAELARQAAERRQRFETRRRGDSDGRFATPSTAVLVVGALILLAGIGFGASRLLSDDDGGTDSATGGGGAQGLACAPSQTKVAVLNGTPESGLAADFARDLSNRGYDVGPISNTESPSETSTVMFAQGSQDCAPEVAPIVDITQTEQMDQEVRTISEGAQVAVVLGEDKVLGSDTAEGSIDSSSSASTLGD